MTEASTNEETKEKQVYILNNDLQVLEELRVLEELEKEEKMLYEEKMNLLDIENKLVLKINEEIENKRQKREQLRVEVEDLRKRCEELTNLLNLHIT
jgi:hypothetical protein